jgi:aminopeptidase N
VRFEIEGEILVHPLDNNYWVLGMEPWFPLPGLAARAFTARTTIRVAKPFRPIAPGITVRRAEEGGFHLLETRVDTPVQFLTILAGAYAWEKETRNGVTLRVASYGGRNPTAYRSLLDLGFATLGFYEVFLGKMPFRELTIVELAAWSMGQAPAGLLLITSEAFNPMGKGAYRRSAAGVNERFAHELAHQWWGHGVRMPDHSEQWLSESFAEYCSAFFIRQAAGRAAYDLYLTRWRTRAGETKDSVPILLSHRLRAKNDQIQGERLRTRLLYDKGPLVLAAIHAEIGDEAFLTFLSSVQATLGGNVGTTQRVEEVLEAVTKKDWTRFFDRYVRGTDIPLVPAAK